MSNKTKLINRWIKTYGIHSVIYDDDHSPTPSESSWDLDKVWTHWDSYGEMGDFITPGFFPREDISGDWILVAWYLGDRDTDESSENIIVVDRDGCEECDNEGCDACGDTGWIERDYLGASSAYKNIVDVGVYNHSSTSDIEEEPTSHEQVTQNFCPDCGNRFTNEAKFCSTCGIKRI